MTFEMHDFCNAENWDRILRIIRKIVKTHIPVWVHGNNNGCYMKCDKGIVPNLLEITFVNSDYYRVEDIRTSFPTPLDYVNIEGILEIELGEW